MTSRKSSHPFKVGYVTIAGKPNVGKSTLMNAMLQQKLAIVSRRPQTTRNRILGILNSDDHQVIFLDTPGVMTPHYLLQKTMVKTAVSTLNEADLILMMIESRGLDEKDEEVFKAIEKINIPRMLIINKVDLTPSKESLLPLIHRMQKTGLFKEIIPVSALKFDGLDPLLSLILEVLPAGEPFYPQDMISDEPERFFVSEIIREKIFLNYGEEIPYATAVTIDEFTEKPGQKDYIHAVIHVERESQKGILIGKQGHAIKRIGKTAREEIEQFLDRPVFLKLDVKLKKKWRRNAALLKGLGYRAGR